MESCNINPNSPGAKFTQTLVIGWWDNPDATYAQLAMLIQHWVLITRRSSRNDSTLYREKSTDQHAQNLAEYFQLLLAFGEEGLA